MTGKVKLTQKQFDWLERYKSEEEIDYAIDIQLHRKRPDSPVADWKPSEVARAFYNGYEVEAEYKVGDWVLITEECSHKNRAYKIHHFAEGFANLDYENGFRSYWPLRDFRHATPEEIKCEKERRVWAGVGREVGEFRSKDIRINKNGEPIIINNTNQARMLFEKGKLKGFYPAESFISFEEVDSNA